MLNTDTSVPETEPATEPTPSTADPAELATAIVFTAEAEVIPGGAP